MSRHGRLRLIFIGSQFSPLRCAFDLAVNRSDKEAASQGYKTADFQIPVKKIKCQLNLKLCLAHYKADVGILGLIFELR